MLGQIHLERLLYQLGARVVKVNAKGTDLLSNCPFEAYTHSDGQDTKPSFGISLGNGHVWNCFSCGKRGRGVLFLLKRLEKFNPQVASLIAEYSELEEMFLANELMDAIQRIAEKYKDSVKNIKFTKVWDESIIEKYKGKIPGYVIDRIGKDVELEEVLNVARLFTLGYDDVNLILIIPIRNSEGVIVGIGRRFLEEGRYMDMFSWNKGDYLYGEQFFDGDNQNVYIVEGYFDVWRMYALGYTNVYGVMHSGITDRQANKIAAFGRNVYLLPDPDEAGKKLIEVAKVKFKSLGVPVFVGKRMLYQDPSYCSKEELEKYINSCIRLI